MSGYFRTSLSAVMTPFPRWDWAVIIARGSRMISKVEVCSMAAESLTTIVLTVSVVVSVTTSVSLTNPRLSFLSNRRRFGLGLSWRVSFSYSAATSILFAGRSS